MMPLAMVKPGEECTIKKIGGKEDHGIIHEARSEGT